MSDFPQPPMPPGYGPGGYTGPQMYPQSPRPTVVTVLAIIGIVWACIQSLIVLFSLALAPVMIAGRGPFEGLGPMPGVWAVYTIASGVLALALAVLLIAASIQSLQLRQWARKGMMVWAGISIVVMIINTAIQVTGANPQAAALQARQQARMQGLNSPQAQNMAQAAQSAGRVGGVCCVAVLLVYPIWILATFNSPRVKAAFGEPTA